MNASTLHKSQDAQFLSEFDYEDPDITEKRKEIEKCLQDPDSVNLEQWQNFATSKGGLISGWYPSNYNKTVCNSLDFNLTLFLIINR